MVDSGQVTRGELCYPVSSMRLAYITNVRLPSERAHGHQVSAVCDALVQLGHDVTIFAPFRRNIVTDNYWTYYGADPRVKIEHLGSFDPIQSPFLPGVAGLFTLNFLLRRALRTTLRVDQFDLLYTRSPALLSALIKTDIPVILELHQLPRRNRRLFVKQCNQCRIVACLTSPMRDVLLEWGVLPERLIIAGDAVDLARFAEPISRESAREQLKLQTERLVVGYVGRLKTLGMEKGVSSLLKALKDLHDSHDFFGLVVGGPESDRLEYQQMSDRLGLTASEVLFTGEMPATSVPLALAACDILVMPFPDVPHYRLYMSPLKMFEYMAANRPIVTSDLPTVRDVLSHETAVFCKPGDTQSLVLALRWIKDHPQEALERAAKAQELVKTHTWEERMKRILSAATLPS
jgi:glycosyltransferase involved in cell wall biosynthesis